MFVGYVAEVPKCQPGRWVASSHSSPGLLDSDLVNSSGVCGLKAKDSQILAFKANSEVWAVD